MFHEHRLGEQTSIQCHFVNKNQELENSLFERSNRKSYLISLRREGKPGKWPSADGCTAPRHIVQSELDDGSPLLGKGCKIMFLLTNGKR